MSNAVAPFGGGGAVADPSALKAGLTKYKQEAPPVIDGQTLLRLLTDGDWVFGAENADVEEGSIWAINPFSITHGLCSWTDHPKGKSNELVGEVMVPFTESAPSEADMRDTGWPWKRQVAIDLLCITGDDKGTQVHYKTTSIGGLRAIDGFINALLKQLGENEAECIGLVILSSDHYEHKKYGRTYVPIIEIDGWASQSDDLLNLYEDEGEPEKPAPKPKAKPKVTGGRKARTVKSKEEQEAQSEAEVEPEQAPTTEEAPPPRRRRRSA